MLIKSDRESPQKISLIDLSLQSQTWLKKPLHLNVPALITSPVDGHQHIETSGVINRIIKQILCFSKIDLETQLGFACKSMNHS